MTTKGYKEKDFIRVAHDIDNIIHNLIIRELNNHIFLTSTFNPKILKGFKEIVVDKNTYT